MPTSNQLYILIIGILIFDFIINKAISLLNAKSFDAPLPDEVSDIFAPDEYQKSQDYKKTNFKFGLLSSTFSFISTFAFILLGGFEYVDQYVRTISSNPLAVSLLFFGILFFANEIISIPFSYYKIFVIEERFGFNKMNIKTFITDKLKGWFMGILIGGGIFATIILFYQWAGKSFWLYAWGIVTFFTLFMNVFYAKLIVPLFNKQTPLEEGSLRNKIATYSDKVGFKLDNIFVIDGSKRSTKANAYFSGLGKEKRITLYDTLINDLSEEEIVAVLAHEVGHYKRKHIISNLIISIMVTGLTFWVLSLFIDNPTLSEALGVSVPSFHIGLIAFGILYSPLSEITGIIMNSLSRKFEYQADDYAKNTYEGVPLIHALKKLSKKSLSNLTPHPAYVFMHYSHPTLTDRIRNLQKR